MVTLDVEFVRKREVSAITNPAKIGMILRLPMLSESYQMVRGTFQDCTISILDVTASIPTREKPVSVLKLKNFRLKDPD